jgi:beta-lactamase class A
MRRLKKQYMQGTKKSQVVLALVLIATLACVAFVLWWFYENTSMKEDGSVNNPVAESQVTQEQTLEEQPETKAELFDAQELQKIVEDWASPKLTDSSRASVVLMDEDGNLLAGFKIEGQYFAASIYKLFVTYEGYRQVDAELVNAQEVYQGGRTRIECLDAMIRDSDSPCGEKMWDELGKESLTDILISYGIMNTSMIGLSTTAEDAGKMLSKIAKGDGLSDSSRQLYLSSMKEQDALYRRGFPSGFSEDTTVYNKVGWNEQQEWHDVGIIETADGRKLIYAVMTENVGSKQIAQLAKEIEATF